jgi:hypothetical protein
MWNLLRDKSTYVSEERFASVFRVEEWFTKELFIF